MKTRLFFSFVSIFFVSSLFLFSLASQPRSDDNPRMVEIILDASGSMNGQLSSGQLKIAAAKEAVTRMAENLPDSLVLAFRAYGHQSPREKKDCQDTQLLLDFAPLKDIRQNIISQAKALKAQGYTPITFVLGKAALDFPDGREMEKIIILVSDGKETCESDPCLTAKKLKEKNINLAIHTIGFGVDTATKEQLECISKMTGGKYFSAKSTEELILVLQEAVETSREETAEEEGTGKLKVEGADLKGHKVINADTGEQVAFISYTKNTIELPAGIYNVTVAKAVWKSVVVKAGETTVLQPGWLKVKNASFKGHRVLDAETRDEHGSVSSLHRTLTLMPGEYLVTFGSLFWPVSIEEGQTVTLNPGVIKVKRASYRGHVIRTADGKVVGSVSNTASSMPLPPGEYTIEIGGKTISFALKKGENLVFQSK